MSSKITPILSLLLCVLISWNCGNDLDVPVTNPAQQLQTDIDMIKSYLTTNGLTAQETNTGLHFIVEEQGTGAAITATSSINILLRGYFLNGEVFDETEECFPLTITLDRVIPGIAEGLQKFNVGGKGSMFLPSALAFGQSGNGNAIPVNSVLAFDIEVVDQRAFDSEKIATYLESRNLESTTTSTGLQYIIEEQGEGDNPTSSSRVTVNYKGMLLDGTVFDQREFQSFGLDQVILGWREGIPLLKPGGRGTFFIPSELGYSTAGTANIPPNAVLIFEVELLEVN